jgi:23S rRNA (cytosine1962-C5)-methyltransferase
MPTCSTCAAIPAGLGVYAKKLGGAREVTCVDLDETAIAVARQNANLNQVRVQTVHADAFPYLRQMRQNERTYDVVVLDPPKLVFGRKDDGDGRDRYFDLNCLAAPLVRSGRVAVDLFMQRGAGW